MSVKPDFVNYDESSAPVCESSPYVENTQRNNGDGDAEANDYDDCRRKIQRREEKILKDHHQQEDATRNQGSSQHKQSYELGAIYGRL